MLTEKSAQKEVPSWELSDELWQKIEPLLPKPKSRLRGRGKTRRHVGGRPAAPRHPRDNWHTPQSQNRMPVERGAQGVWFWPDPAPVFPDVGSRPSVQEDVASRIDGI